MLAASGYRLSATVQHTPTTAGNLRRRCVLRPRASSTSLMVCTGITPASRLALRSPSLAPQRRLGSSHHMSPAVAPEAQCALKSRAKLTVLKLDPDVRDLTPMCTGLRRPARTHDAARSAQAVHRVHQPRGQGQEDLKSGKTQDLTPRRPLKGAGSNGQDVAKQAGVSARHPRNRTIHQTFRRYASTDFECQPPVDRSRLLQPLL